MKRNKFEKQHRFMNNQIFRVSIEANTVNKAIIEK